MVDRVVPFRRKKEHKVRRARRKGSNILLIGSPLQTRPIEIMLADFKAEVLCAEWHELLPDEIVDATEAVIVVEPLPKISLIQAAKTLRNDLNRHKTALFAIVGEGISDSRARRIYDSGTTAVFEWPRDAKLFPNLVAEMLAIELVRGKTRGPDRALKRTVEARLKSASGVSGGLIVGARHGVISLSGNVDSLWKKHKIEEMVARIPGVRGIVTLHLRVPASGLSDRAIANKVRAVLRSTSDVDPTTITVSVRNGAVILAGSAANRSELEHLNEVVRSVRGVRHIENLVTISKSQKEADHQVSRRIKKLLEGLFPDKELAVAVFGDVAVVSGQVDLLKTKTEIGRLVAQDRAVGHFINKITIE